jgi:hypothetical protein
VGVAGLTSEETTRQPGLPLDGLLLPP